jgi:hypothetical protein
VHTLSRSLAAFASRAEPLPSSSNTPNPDSDRPSAANASPRREQRMSYRTVNAFNRAFNFTTRPSSSRSAHSGDTDSSSSELVFGQEFANQAAQR